MTTELLLNVNDESLAMSVTEFKSMASLNMRETIANGFVNWGRQLTTSSYTVNEGLWTFPTLSGNLRLGRAAESSATKGESETGEAIVNVNGVMVHLKTTHFSDYLVTNMPPVPDGLDKIDGTGRFADIAAALVAGGTELSQSVITRKDLVFLEVWPEKVSRTGMVYPYGSVQYGYGALDTVTLTNSIVPQKYSAVGDWDTTTTGYGVKLDTLSGKDRSLFLNNREHNIYMDNGELIQIRWRIRAVKGLGDSWFNTDVSSGNWLKYSQDSSLVVKPRGHKTTLSKDIDIYDGTSVEEFGLYAEPDKLDTNFENPSNRRGAWTAPTAGTDRFGYGNECYAIPVALVQRRNSGCSAPNINPEGCRAWGSSVNNFFSFIWHDSPSSNDMPKSTMYDCFNGGTDNVNYGGNLGSAAATRWNGDGKYYDVVYTDDVYDLRMSANKMDMGRLREFYMRKSMSGNINSQDSVPLTKVYDNGGALYYSVQNWRNARFNEGPNNTGESVKFTRDLGIPAFTPIHVYQPSTGLIYYGSMSVSDGHIALSIDPSTYGMPVETFVNNANLLDSSQPCYVIAAHDTGVHFSNPSTTDIVGSPVNILATFPNGCNGRWLPTVPDGTSTYFQFTRKYYTSISRTYSTNNGNTWTNLTGNPPGLSLVLNSYYNPEPSTLVIIIHYETIGHFTEAGVNGKVLSLGEVTLSASGADIDDGVILGSSTTGLINKGSFSYAFKRIPLTIVGMDPKTEMLTSDTKNGICEHDYPQLSWNNNSVGFKCVDYITSVNKRLRMNFLISGLTYDSSSDHQSEFIDMSDQDATVKIAGTIYNINGSRNKGLWLCMITNSIALTVGEMTRIGNKIIDGAGVTYYKAWHGKGWGDDNRFNHVDAPTMEVDVNGKYYRTGTYGFNLPYFK